MPSDHAQVAREFPDYDVSTLPPIPDDFTSTAWHHESCPTWAEDVSTGITKRGDLMLSIDYPDPARREDGGGWRFNLHMVDGQGNPEFLCGRDEWEPILTAIRFAQRVRFLGLGFHVDTRGANYVLNADGSRVFTDEEAFDHDRLVEDMHDVVEDVFDLTFTIWRAMGLIGPTEG